MEFLEFKLDNIEQSQEQTELEEKEVSFTEVAKEFIGCLDSNLEDLSHRFQPESKTEDWSDFIGCIEAEPDLARNYKTLLP